MAPATRALEGGGGNETLDGGTGADTMLSGIGNDTYVVDDALDVVTEAADEGTDAVQASITYTLGDDVENLALTGSADINGTGNALANTIIGNSANNTLDGGAGADTMSGGAGDDIYLVDNIGDTVMENADEGTDAVISTVSYTLGDDIEILQLEGSANLTGTGNALDNVIFSNSGVDTLVGGTCNDIYYVHNAADQVVESAGEGTDTVYTDKSYTLADNVENLALLAATGITATGNSLANTITGNDFGSTLDGGGGADTLQGNGGNDVSCSMSGKPMATSSATSTAMEPRREIRCGSSAMGRVRRSPTSTSPTGRSTTLAARRTRASRSATPRRSTQATSCSFDLACLPGTRAPDRLAPRALRA